jgi:hypothetical protein
VREAPCQPVDVAFQDHARGHVAAGCGPRDLLRRQRVAGEGGVLALQRGAAQIGLDAPVQPTVAGWSRTLVVRGLGQRVVAPLAGDGVT